MSSARRLGKVKRAPSRDSIVALFVAGALLLVVPLFFVLSFGAQPCGQPRPLGASCSLPALYKGVVSILPYVMIIGGVLIAYNFKRISDSLLPRDEDESELER